jgi:alanyl-tRNA synthetase
LSQALERIQQYFKDDDTSEAYVAILDVDGNSKVRLLSVHGPCVWYLLLHQILQSVVTQGKKLGKAVYVLSIDTSGGKVAHVNYVPAAMQVKGLDARTWASKVAEVLGGKASLNTV